MACSYENKYASGQKCRYYILERGNQPQLSVVDEVIAMSRSTVTRTASEGMVVKKQVFHALRTMTLLISNIMLQSDNRMPV